MIKRYKVYDQGQFVGIMTATEVEKKTGLNRNYVNVYASRNAPYKQRYLFEQEKLQEGAWTVQFREEWDKWRGRILTAGGAMG